MANQIFDPAAEFPVVRTNFVPDFSNYPTFSISKSVFYPIEGLFINLKPIVEDNHFVWFDAGWNALSSVAVET